MTLKMRKARTRVVAAARNAEKAFCDYWYTAEKGETPGFDCLTDAMKGLRAAIAALDAAVTPVSPSGESGRGGGR
jgi:hypothetical protein